MLYITACLYIAGMPVAVHLTDEVALNVRRRERVVVALAWPLLSLVYVGALVSVLWGKR
jgi:hypothetical protein